jgi:hypothetical protein
MFSTPILDGEFRDAQNWSFSIGIENECLYLKNKGIDLDIELLGIRYMSRLDFFYHGLPKLLMKIVVCGFPYKPPPNGPIEISII